MARPKRTLDSLAADWKERLFTLASEGASDIEIRAELKISDDLWERWIAEEPEFARAVKEGKAQCAAWWLKLGREMAAGKLSKFNVVAWIFNMKNRFGWVDRQEIDSTNRNLDGERSKPAGEMTDAELEWHIRSATAAMKADMSPEEWQRHLGKIETQKPAPSSLSQLHTPPAPPSLAPHLQKLWDEAPTPE